MTFHSSNGSLELLGSYEVEDMPVRTTIANLAYFNPIQEVEAMCDKCIAVLPKDAPKISYVQQ